MNKGIYNTPILNSTYHLQVPEWITKEDQVERQGRAHDTRRAGTTHEMETSGQYEFIILTSRKTRSITIMLLINHSFYCPLYAENW